MDKTLKEEIDALSLNIAYELYKLDWCMRRGWKISDVQMAFDNDTEYHGQMFVCKDEFEECEYQNKEYIEYLFSEEFNKKLDEYKNEFLDIIKIELLKEENIKWNFTLEV